MSSSDFKFKGMRVWLPAIRAHSGADMFTLRLAALLTSGGLEGTITWLPHWVEPMPPLAIARPPAGTQVVHANSWNAWAFGGPALPRVVTVHHCVHDPDFTPYKSFGQRVYHDVWIRPMERRSLDGAAAVTADSEFTRQRVIAAFGPRPIDVVPLWIDTERFRPRPAASRTGPFRLLFSGNWGARKGTDLLPGLMRALGPAFELRFTTGGRAAMPPVALPGNMRWAGRVADETGMVELYRGCDAVVVPSRLEGFGYAALEAMACGKPVIAFDVSSIPEIVDDGVTGRLVPLGDVAAMAQACRQLADDPALLRRLGEAAREAAVARFSGERALAGYLAVYEKALASR